MATESLTMLTWALEHPYLYTIIKIKPPIIAIAVYVVVKLALKLTVKGR